MHGLLGYQPSVFAYADDVPTLSSSLEEHEEHLRKVIALGVQRSLKDIVRKCDFTQKRVAVLGDVSDKYDVRVD